MASTEGQLQAALLLAAPQRIPSLRLFRRNIATILLENRFMKFGIAGQCDLYGYFKGGRAIEIELKTATKSSSSEQIAWAEFCRRWGVTHLLLKARAKESVEETVNRWLLEIVQVVELSQ